MTRSAKIIAIPALKDNYIWLFFDENTRQAWAVDPGDAAAVIPVLEQHQLQLAGILITHHHHDHSGGIADLIAYAGRLQVIGPQYSPLTTITQRVKENDCIHAAPFSLRVLDIPGHTLDHTAYYNDAVIFCGDTLFSAGCGRIFEGTPAQMYHTLQKILSLPTGLLIYCGHEYTMANLAFAQLVEPQNPDINKKIAKTQALRNQGLPSLPAVLSEEKKINPFLRCDQLVVKKAVENQCGRLLKSPVEVFTYLRQWKNQI